MNTIGQAYSTGIEPGLEIEIKKDELTGVELHESVTLLRPWQIGDLIVVGNCPERRLIINLTEGHFEVIAESGWWNRYQTPSEFAIRLCQPTDLRYDYKGREPLHRDYVSGLFTEFFNL